MNAVVASGVSASDYAERRSTPPGSTSPRASARRSAPCLAGSAELISEAWRYKQMWGGAMRQAGVIAAAGPARARPPRRPPRRRPRQRAAPGRGGSRRSTGSRSIRATVETNIVACSASPTRRRFCAALEAEGVRHGHARAPTAVRAVTPPWTSTRSAIDARARARPEGALGGLERAGSLPRRMAVAHRTCPFCEATCGLELDARRRARDEGPRRRRRRLLQGLPVPEGRVAQGAARRPRPAAHADDPHGGRLVPARRRGTRRSALIAEQAAAAPRRRRARRVRGLPRQPVGAQPRARCSTAGRSSRRSGRRTSSRRRPSTSTPSRWPPR